MARWLSRSEWEHLIPQRPGRVRVNHDSDECQGDSLSLMITLKDTGEADAHCFRCQARGWRAPEGFFKKPEAASKTDLVEHGAYDLPADVTSEWGKFPPKVLAWLWKAHLTEDSTAGRELLWSPAKDTLYLPMEQEGESAYGPKLAGYVLRRFEPKGYLTLTADKDAFWGAYRGPDEASKRVVLVEDVLSAWRVAEFEHSVALAGVHVKAGVLAYLLRMGYTKGVVWLDYDNPQVKMRAQEAAKRLSWMQGVQVVALGDDPKNLSRDELRRVLTQP